MAKQNCAVPVIDQKILLLLILQIWNLERNISGFEPESAFIIISCGLVDIERREDGLRVIHSAWSMYQSSYPSSFALARATLASDVRSSA